MAVFTYPSPVPVLPFLNGFSVHKKPIWANFAESSVSGREVVAAVAAFPLWEFDLTFEALRTQTQNSDTYGQYAGLIDYEQMLMPFLIAAGQYGRFYYNDPTDCSREGQVIGTGTGSRVSWPMVRSLGGSIYTFLTEPVGAVNTNMLMTVYVDGSPLSASDWALDAAGRVLTLDSAPADGDVVTADFFFYYFCRFVEDVTDFSQFLHNLWSLQTLKFRSVKP